MATGRGYEVSEFTIHIPDEKLDDMYERLRRTRFPQDYANDDWRYGYNTENARELVRYWLGARRVARAPGGRNGPDHAHPVPAAQPSAPPRHALGAPQEFVELGEQARALGFRGVLSGPLVRSSYRAGTLWAEAVGSRAAS